MITITYENLMMFLALFTALCVAGGWLIKIIRGIKKPSNDVLDMLAHDNKRLQSLEEDREYMKKAVALLMQSNLAILGHLQTDNNTGEMVKTEERIKEFLINNR